MARRTLVVLIVLSVALVVDLRRAPAQQLSTSAAIGAIHLYQATLSPVYSRMGLQCRFTPTCSRYGEACVQEFGALRGGWLAMSADSQVRALDAAGDGGSAAAIADAVAGPSKVRVEM